MTTLARISNNAGLARRRISHQRERGVGVRKLESTAAGVCNGELDPELTPSWHGQDCQGNGEHPGIECCCDECAHYLECFPDWEQLIDATASQILDRFRPAFEELAK